MRALRYALICLAAAWSSASAAGASADDPKTTGPLGLLIQYRCAPAKRVDFRSELGASAVNFDSLKNSGAIVSYRLLFSRYVDSNAWDAMALIDFRRYDGLKAWKTMEKKNPAGLSRRALDLVNSIETYPTDLVRGKQTAIGDHKNRNSVYMVIPYALSVPVPAYLQYADGYVIPQFEGWKREGLLIGYQLEMQRYTAGRPWDAMVILEYKDDDSLGKREDAVAKIRRELAANPVWKAISDNKQSVRTEKMPVIADELLVSGQAKE